MKKIMLIAVAALLLPAAAFARGDEETDEAPAVGPGARGVPNVMRGVGVVDAEAEPGILVLRVLEDSPAEEAGVIRGDIVLEVEGSEVNTVAQLQQLLGDFEAGDTVEALILRGGEEVTVGVTLETRLNRPAFGIQGGGFTVPGYPMAPGRSVPSPSQRMMPGGRGSSGFRFDLPEFERPVSPECFTEGFLMESQGVIVSTVVEGSPADEAGLMAHDIIASVDGVELEDPDVGEAIEQLSPGDVVELGLYRITDNNEMEEITISVRLGADDDGGAYLGIGFMPLGSRVPGVSQRFDRPAAGAYNPRSMRM